MYIVVEHHIQHGILLSLATSKSMRFSQLKPQGLESNSFMYHLKDLIKTGLVKQLEDKSYTLTPQGMSYFDGLSLTNNKPRRQPKLISIIVLQNAEGKYLMAERKMQPNIGYWMLPSGKQHFGESSDDHVHRELREQLGVSFDLERRGTLDLRLSHQSELVTHLMAQVFSGRYDGPAPAESVRFRYSWRTPEGTSMTAGTAELLASLEKQQDIFLSLDLNAD
jgi:8-oxo-dGTP pyrophosphatase MutT (NUDIX family)